MNASANEWIIGNIKHSGFYRVNYDEDNWNLLTNQLNTDHSQIDELSRATLIDDAFNLAKGEVIKQIRFFDVIKHLEHETSHIPWTPARDGLSYINTMIYTCNNWTYTAYKV